MLAIFTDTNHWTGVDILTQRFAIYLRDRGIAFVLVADGPSRLREAIPWAHSIGHEEFLRSCENGGITHVHFPSVAMLRRDDIDWSGLGRARIFTLVVQAFEPMTRFVPALTFGVERLGYLAVRIAKAMIPDHICSVSALFEKLVMCEAVGMMDSASVRALRSFFPRVKSPPIIPIPAAVEAKILPAATPSSAATAIAYLGRLDRLKWSALKPLIQGELAGMAKTRQIDFHAVAEGESIGELVEECRRHGLILHHYGFLPNKQARTLIANNADMALAMGTSALDLAGSGIPCVIIDMALRPNAKPQTLFHFMHEVEGFTLGQYRDAPEYEPHGRSLAECLAIASHFKGVESEYVRKNHDPNLIFEDTLQRIFKSNLTGDTLAPLLNDIEWSFKRMRRFYGWVGTASAMRR